MGLLRRLEVDMPGVLGTTGITLLVIGVAQLAPAAVAFATGAPALRLTLGALAVIGIAGALVPLRRQARKWTRRESLAIVLLSWLGAIVAGAVPFWVTGIAGPFDALFEAASGITTTGASIFVDVDRLSTVPLPDHVAAHPVVPALHLWRALMHWLGGAGIVLVVVIISPFLEDVEALRRTQRAETSLLTERYRGSTKATMRGLLTVYVGATTVFWLVLVALGLGAWDALVHALSTLATGGYSNRSASLGAWGNVVQLVTVAFMVLGALNFALLGRIVEEVRAEVGRAAAAEGRLLAARFALGAAPRIAARSLWRSGEARGYLLLLFVAAAAIALLLALSGDARYRGAAGLWQGVVDAAFNVVSISTTTGFGTVDYVAWPVACQAILLGLMVMGGCAGSTAGGIKVRRALIVLKYAYREVVRFTHPRAVLPIRLGETVVPEEHVREALGFVTTYLAVMLTLGLVVALAGRDPVTTAGAAVSAVGSIGPGFGEVGPAGSFQGFPGWTKLALGLGMLLGRLEILPVLTACVPSFWVRRAARTV
ncbi:MAG: TrkH family potassium uptake protein [Planctomycetes bacterium]|nr:TrkH family potassium uptake protein [Planctomycetota bacterium]